MGTGNVNGLTINGLDSVSGSSSDYAVTKYTYDNMNRLVSETDPLGQTQTYSYDYIGNLTTTTDKNGSTLTYSYDGLNRLIGKSSSADTADTYAYAYNKKGLRTAMTGGGVDASYIYDGIGRLTKETLTDGTVKEYNYDMNGNRTGFKLTKDNVQQYTLTYTYDKMNQLTKVSENGTTKAEYTYNNDGTLKKSTYGERTTDYIYNLANLLTEVNNAKGTTQISKYNYTYYLDGNQKSKSESVSGTSNGTTSYTYDGLNRLIKEQTPDNTYNYQYDEYGNRSQLSVTGDETYTTAYTYDKNNRLRKQTKTAGAASEITDYWYDPNGNQISSMTASTGTSGTPAVGIQLAGQLMNTVNEYDSWNQLTKTMQGGKTTSYTYNGDGLRMSKNVGGTTTSHIWDGTNIAADVTGGTVTKYIRGVQLISAKTGSTESFYNYNGHGDVVQLTNSSGTVTKQYGYDAFGNEMNKVDSDTNPFRYCGEYQDLCSGLIYLRNRYYDPSVGRFISEDPIRSGTNWYVYCENNPIRYTDSFGLDKNLDDYINANYAGKMTVTVAISRPVPNSRAVATINSSGMLDNGHSFLRLDDGNGNVKYLGLAPTEKSLTKMLLAEDVGGKMVDDSLSPWNVARVFELNSDQYNDLSAFLASAESSTPNYNIRDYNCTTFAVEGLKKAGINSYRIGIYEHRWTLPDNLYEQLKGYSARGKIPTWIATAAVWTMGRFDGYTPADAVQDLKGSEGTTLLQYDSTGVKTIQNQVYWSSK